VRLGLSEGLKCIEKGIGISRDALNETPRSKLRGVSFLRLDRITRGGR
jgi:hypothetical protein